MGSVIVESPQAERKALNIEIARWVCVGFREEFIHMMTVFPLAKVRDCFASIVLPEDISFEKFEKQYKAKYPDATPEDIQKAFKDWSKTWKEFVNSIYRDDNRLFVARNQLSTRFIQARKTISDAGAAVVMNVGYTAALKDVSKKSIDEILKEADDENPNQ